MAFGSQKRTAVTPCTDFIRFYFSLFPVQTISLAFLKTETSANTVLWPKKNWRLQKASNCKVYSGNHDNKQHKYFIKFYKSRTKKLEFDNLEEENFQNAFLSTLAPGIGILNRENGFWGEE